MKLIYTGTTKERLDKFIHTNFPDISRNQIQKHLQTSPIKVNNKSASVHHWLKQGDKIEMTDFVDVPTLSKLGNIDTPTIISQTNDYAVLEKPAGLLIHPTEKNETNTLSDWLVKRFPEVKDVGDDPQRPGIIHRLDKDVGGLVVIAKNQKFFDYAKNLFQERQITKKYYCLVHGQIVQEEGNIATPIERSRETGRMIAQSATASGKNAITLYRTLKKFRNYTLLDVQIVTGRTHQIRTHLFSIGHSVVGDLLYQTRNIKKKKKNLIANRPLLFAYYLSFVGMGGELQEFSLDFPNFFTNITSQLQSI